MGVLRDNPGLVLLVGIVACTLALIGAVLSEVNAASVLAIGPLLTESECDKLIVAAEETAMQANGWSTNRHAHYPTTDVSAYTFDLPTQEWLNATVIRQRALPSLANAYNVPLQLLDARDVFVVKYSEDAQRSLHLHRDGSHLTFAAALSVPKRDFSGGALFVDTLNQTIEVEQGHAVLHPSRLYHAGVAITRGQRYLLVGFVYVKTDLRAALRAGDLRGFITQLLLYGRFWGATAKCIDVRRGACFASDDGLCDGLATSGSLDVHRCNSWWIALGRPWLLAVETMRRDTPSAYMAWWVLILVLIGVVLLVLIDCAMNHYASRHNDKKRS